jgi:Tfp pilus assembly protein PilF
VNKLSCGRSLECESNSLAWTYLGVIYLQLGHTHLANRAFKEAQAQEPSYLRGWAGQALVAEVPVFLSQIRKYFES